MRHYNPVVCLRGWQRKRLPAPAQREGDTSLRQCAGRSCHAPHEWCLFACFPAPCRRRWKSWKSRRSMDPCLRRSPRRYRDSKDTRSIGHNFLAEQLRRDCQLRLRARAPDAARWHDLPSQRGTPHRALRRNREWNRMYWPIGAGNEESVLQAASSLWPSQADERWWSETRSHRACRRGDDGCPEQECRWLISFPVEAPARRDESVRP